LLPAQTPTRSPSPYVPLGLLAFAALIGGVVLLVVLPGSMKVIGGVLVIGGFVGLIGVAIAGHKRTLRLQREFAAQIGFEVVRPAGKEQRAGFFQGIKGLAVCNNGARGVQWFATGAVGGRPIAVCAYQQPGGENDSGTVYLLAVTPCDPRWPGVQVGRGSAKLARAIIRGLVGIFGANLLPPLEGFSPGLDVRSADEAFARRVVGEAFQQSILQSPEREQWEINAGRVSVGLWASAGKDFWIGWVAERLAVVTALLEEAAQNEQPRAEARG
jgi:hypothetical protein